MTTKDTDHAGAVGVCAAAMPVLISQIESARTQAADAVRALNTGFAGIMRQLSEMSAMAMAVHDGGSAAFERIDREFVDMADAQATLARDYAELAKKTGGMTQRTSNLLALARKSGQDELVSTVESIATELFEVIDSHQRLSEQAKAAGTRAESRIDAVLAPYGEALSKLSNYGDGMRAEMTECLIQLQFQDRMSQILQHVTSSMELLTEYLHNGAAQGETIQAETFLKKIADSYTTEEQRINHANGLRAARK